MPESSPTDTRWRPSWRKQYPILGHCDFQKSARICAFQYPKFSQSCPQATSKMFVIWAWCHAQYPTSVAGQRSPGWLFEDRTWYCGHRNRSTEPVLSYPTDRTGFSVIIPVKNFAMFFSRIKNCYTLTMAPTASLLPDGAYWTLNKSSLSTASEFLSARTTVPDIHFATEPCCCSVRGMECDRPGLNQPRVKDFV